MDSVESKILAGATIVDVRNPGEFDEGHYKNALNIPVNALPNRMGEIGAKTAPVVVYCASGGRSSVAAAILKAQGFTDVTNAGGIDEMP